MDKKMTGYASIDKPWLKYYSEEAIDAPLPRCTIFEYLYENNKKDLDNIALEYFGKSITYRSLFSRIKHAAACFASIGVKAGDTVVLMLLNSPEAIISLYALNLLGAIADFIYFKKDTFEISKELEQSKAKYFVCQYIDEIDYSCFLSLSFLEKCVCVPLDSSMPFVIRIAAKLQRKKPPLHHKKLIMWNEFLKQSNKDIESTPYSAYRTAVVVHTGGTTGVPKGVMLSNDNLNACVFQTRLADMGWERKKKIIHTIPPFVAYGITIGTHMALCHGMRCIITPNPDPEQTGYLLHKHRPYAIVAGPPHIESILNYKALTKKDLATLNILIVGGESLTLERERQANAFLRSMNSPARIQTGYGMTETCSAVCVNMDKNRRKEGSLGIPFSHTIIATFDPDTGEEMPYGQEGEICIASPNNMLGYKDRVAENNSLIKQHDNHVWIHTGDMGKINEDGFVYICGRIKRIYTVKNRGDGSIYKLFPTYVEECITEVPSVVNSCVICKKDSEIINVPIAYVELNSLNLDVEQIKQEILAHCKEHLPPYCVPHEVRFIERIPLTAVGKKDYRQLEKEASREYAKLV